MKIDVRIFPFCLYDTHRIQKCRTFKEAAERWTDEDETRMYLESNLNNHFLFRMHRDPGFHQYVLKSVMHDEQLIRRAKHYLKKLFYDWTCDISSYHFSAPDIAGQSDEAVEKIIGGVVAQYENETSLFENPEIIMVNKEYFEYLYRLASCDQDEVSTSVIRDLRSKPFAHNKWGMVPFYGNVSTPNQTSRMVRKNKFKHFFTGSLGLSDTLLKSEQGESDSWINAMIKSANKINPHIESDREISNVELSAVNNDIATLSPFFCVTPFLKELRFSFASDFNIQVPEDLWVNAKKFHSYSQQEKHNYVRFLKFTTDALAIASEFWFSQMDEDRKITLLSAEYPFEVDKESLWERPLELVDRYANEFSQFEDYEVARVLFMHCLERAATDIERFYFNVALGHCSRLLEDFRSARDYYATAHTLISCYLRDPCWHEYVSCALKRHPYSAKYWQLLSKAIVAEMDFHLRKTGDIKKAIDYVLSKCGSLSEPERCQLLLDLSYVCENTGNPGRELRALEKLLKEPQISKKTREYVERRRLFLTKPHGPSRKKSLEKQHKYDTLRKIMALNYKQMLALQSFQATRLLWYSKQVYNLNQEISPEDFVPPAAIGMSLFYLQRYEEAIPFFQEHQRKCTIPEPGIHEFAGYSGICLICAGKEEDGVRVLKAEINHLAEILPCEEAGEAIGTLLNNVAMETLILGEDATERIIESLAEEVEGGLSDESSAFYISSAYVRICWFSKAIEKVDRLLEKVGSDVSKRAFLLLQKGSLHTANGDLDAALSCYLEAEKSYVIALPGKERSDLMKKMAEVYIQKMNLPAARKCLETAIKCNPEDKGIERIRNSIDGFLSDHLSIESVQDRVARYSLRTAEKEALDLYKTIKEDEEFDFSPPLMNYAKGLEALLEHEIWDGIRDRVLGEFSTEDSYGIPDTYYYDLPTWWRGPLSRNDENRKTVSLGTWARLNLNHSNGNPVIEAVLRHLRESYDEEKFRVVTDACKYLAPYRNEVAHGGVKDKGELLEVRRTVINQLNAVILLLYGPEGSEEFNSTFTEEHGDVVLVEKAIKYAEDEEYDKALECYRQAVEIDPTNTDAHIGKGQIYTNLGDYKRAEACLDIALQFDANDTDALHAKGCLYFEMGDYGLAAQNFQTVLRIDPSHDMAMLNLGCAFRQMFENGMALQCFENVRKMNPENPHLEEEYKSCLLAIDVAKDGLQRIEEKLSSCDEDGSLHMTKGFLLYGLGRYQDALKEFDSAIERGCDDSGLWLFGGQAFLRLNRIDEANLSFEKAGIKLDERIE